MSGCTSLTLVNSATTCTVSYSRAGGHQITATYRGDGNFNGSTSSAAQVSVRARVAGRIKSSMLWTFAYTPSYTRVIELLVNGTTVGDSVVVKCGGKGCPFTKRVRMVTKGNRCSKVRSAVS